MKRNITIGIATVILVALGWLAVTTSRAGYETADYELLEKEDEFEIREYPELVTVATNAESGDDPSFMRLFKYISGENQSEQKIAMTTPVFMPSGEDAAPGSMHFVLPKEVAENGAPDPKRKGVELSRFQSGKYAAVRFSGKLNKETRQKALEQLKAELKSRDLETKGTPIYAGYDSPWTPGPLRRNEVLLKLAAE